MSVSQSWWEAAYVAMIPVLRKQFDDQDLVHDAAVERLIEISKKRDPAPASEGEFVGLCLYGAAWRARDLQRKWGRLRRRWAPPEEFVDPWAEPKAREVRMLLQVQWACLRRLPDRSRRLLELYYFDGRSDRDVARLLAGMSARAIGREDAWIRKSLAPGRGGGAAERAEAKARKRAIGGGSQGRQPRAPRGALALEGVNRGRGGGAKRVFGRLKFDARRGPRFPEPRPVKPFDVTQR